MISTSVVAILHDDTFCLCKAQHDIKSGSVAGEEGQPLVLRISLKGAIYLTRYASHFTGYVLICDASARAAWGLDGTPAITI